MTDNAVAVWADGVRWTCPARTVEDESKDTSGTVCTKKATPGFDTKWNGKDKEGNSLTLRLRHRKDDQWIQLWNNDTVQQVFQLKNVSSDAIEWAKAISQEYAAGSIDKHALEIRKKSWVTALAQKTKAESNKLEKDKKWQWMESLYHGVEAASWN